jgi:23S rRNA pseudouridine1911/1915/1917 synthase
MGSDSVSLDIPILFEDNHILVVVKPPNMPSQEDESKDPDLLSSLKAMIKAKYGKPGNVYLGLVHRLDRPVGGVMLFAKTSKAASRLSDAVRTRTIHKTYTAVVRGVPKPSQATLKHFLLKDERTNTVSVVEAAGSPSAKEAILDYEVLESSENGKLSLVRIRLHTGRPHQIRVQLAAIGCPLFGDQRYGYAVNKPGQQIALWATHLSLQHPTLKEPMSFSSAPPASEPWTRWTASPLGGLDTW